ncbi:MAG: TIGR00730 family Rossman fold protein [Alphaproteobacteria bacterium]|jgi:uncharacterized protein (TIGR00730 family)|nr:TIGR00730 family Rossman fold protein [Alphaproteobacteria bacterium]
MIKKVCVFCGAHKGKNPKHVKTAYEMGRRLAEAEKTLVYGAGGVGLMGAVENGIIHHGGKAEGHTTEVITHLEKPIDSPLVKNYVHKDLSLRKRKMMEVSDAFIALPGGVGTIDEITDVLTALQVDEMTGKCLILVGKEFWGPLYKVLRSGWRDGFIARDDFDKFVIVNTPRQAINYLRKYDKLGIKKSFI